MVGRMQQLLVVSILLIWGCTDPVEDDPEVPYQTTPYELYIPSSLPPANFAKDNVPTVEGVELGRRLFYDPILSGDSTQSCASCHAQAFAFTDSEKALSIGIRGMEGKRNSMPIFNLMWHLDGFFWDGRAELLRHQAVLPIQDELEMDETIGNMLAKLNGHPDYRKRFKEAFDLDAASEEAVGKALEQFMSIIISGNSKFDIGRTMGFDNFTESEKRGMAIFNTEAKANDPNNKGGDCFHCHAPPLFMIRGFMNNGLDSLPMDPGRGAVSGASNDIGLFKVPSLRNISYTAPYMHDGRLETLDDVLDFYQTGAHSNSPNLAASMHALKDSVYLSVEQRQDLIAFLLTLNDDTYLTDTAYANPFK